MARRHRRTALKPAQRPGAPTLHQAKVAAPPLPPARRMLTIKDAVDRFLERLWRRSPAPGVQSPAAGAVDGVDETKIGAEQKPQRKNQAIYHRDHPVRAAAVDPAAAMPHQPRFPPVMIIHFHKVHEIGGVKCYKDGCDARFRSEEHRRLHVSYCTEIWKENPKLRHKRFSKGTREDC